MTMALVGGQSKLRNKGVMFLELPVEKCGSLDEVIRSQSFDNGGMCCSFSKEMLATFPGPLENKIYLTQNHTLYMAGPSENIPPIQSRKTVWSYCYRC